MTELYTLLTQYGTTVLNYSHDLYGASGTAGESKSFQHASSKSGVWSIYGHANLEVMKV